MEQLQPTLFDCEKRQRKPSGYWTKERCRKEALKYKRRHQGFEKGSSGAYRAASRNGWLEEICKHMILQKNPPGYWTKVRCQDEALKYKTRKDFGNHSGSAYFAARKRKWIDEICSHMEVLKGKWTKETCKIEARKYKSRKEFHLKSRGSYFAACKNNWLDEVCQHMQPISKPMGYWNKEKCKEEALKYKTRSKFREKSKSAYASSYRKGWLNEICQHMVSPIKPHRYWSKERCKEIALKCETKLELLKNYKSAYATAHLKGWLEEICKHMKPLGNKNKRLIYVYKFSDKSCYIGLTCKFQRRHSEHLKNLVLKKKNDNPQVKYSVLKTEYKYSEKQAKILENKTLLFYKKNHWKILNKAKTGGLGATIRVWNLFSCRSAALECKRKREFSLKYPGAYGAALRNGWLDEICNHMETFKGKWTKEACRKEALKYKTRSAFLKGCAGAHSRASKHSWLDEICQHMSSSRKKGNYWTKEACQNEALKYNERSIFKNESKGCYAAARRNGWLNDICSHMKILKGKWTKEACRKEAQRYKTRSAFWKGCGSAHSRASKNGWLDEICQHMSSPRKQDNYWTKETCQKEALKYKTRGDFWKGCGSAHSRASKNGWLEEICSHMPRNASRNCRWNKEIVMREALKYKKRSDFAKGTKGAYEAAQRNGWLDEICAHMPKKSRYPKQK